MATKTETVYKVCRQKLNGTYASMMGYRMAPEVEVDYAIGMVSHPKIEGSHLMAYRYREDAEDVAADSTERLCVFEAQAELAEGEWPTLRLPCDDTLQAKHVECFWKTGRSLVLMKWPPDTVFCKTVELVRKTYPRDPK